MPPARTPGKPAVHLPVRTARLVIRPWRDEDLAPFAAMNADPEVMRFFPSVLSREESDAVAARVRGAMAERGFGLWAVEVPDERRFIGFVGLMVPRFEAHFTPAVEIGWRIARAYWNRGYATEAAAEALRIGFEEVGLEEIVSMTVEANRPSWRVMQKLGMTRDPNDDFDNPNIPEGHPLRRHILYRLRRDAWAERRPGRVASTATSMRTLAHYEANAESFWEGTRDHDVTQNYAGLLDNLTGAPPFTILDLGCGPGRDLAYFRSLGHEAVGLDGCHAFCAMARAHSGCEVIEQDLLAMHLPARRFDGVFANASLFHVPSADIARVLGELREALKPGGVLFSSNPRGTNDEGFHGERYGTMWDLERWTSVVTAAGFEKITHYYRPAGKPREQQPWLATVWRKPAR